MNNYIKFEQLKTYLPKSGLIYELIHHKPIFSVEEGLQELGIDSSQGFSTLLMKADGNYVAILRRDDGQMSFGKIKRTIGVKNLEFATKEEVLEVTKCEVGYVSPYNPGIKTYMDEKIFEKDFVYGGTGSPEFDLKISPDQLEKLAEAEIIDMAKDSESINS